MLAGTVMYQTLTPSTGSYSCAHSRRKHAIASARKHQTEPSRSTGGRPPIVGTSSKASTTVLSSSGTDPRVSRSTGLSATAVPYLAGPPDLARGASAARDERGFIYEAVAKF